MIAEMDEKLIQKVYQQLPGLVTRKSGNEFIIVPVRNQVADMNCLFTLNETGAFIFERIDGQRTVQEIITILADAYQVEEDRVRDDVINLLLQMDNKVICQR